MKISFNWLKKYISIEETPERVAELLTDTGLEVEGLEKIEGVEGGLKGVVVGEVVECTQHPNADRLRVTQVNVGGPELLQIVCGAPNVAAGQKVMVATVGTTLPIGDKPLKIKKGKLRGETSEGMICAEDELGVGQSHEGILVLPEDTPIGTEAKKYFDLEEDYVFEIGLTPNRADGTSHIGVARDLVALKAIRPELKVSEKVEWPSVNAFQVANTERLVNIQIEDIHRCPRYSGVTISNVKVKPSPKWLQDHLQALGLAPINNVVDSTNFVLHEMGQPLHAFDADQVKGNQIVVKTLPEGTRFTTLDEKERELHQDDLMICSATEGLCIAGVFGGLHSGVTQSTQHVFLESAYFNPVTVRKTAKRHTLNTDASFRYERGTDPTITVYALKRAALLIQELAGGEISMEIEDVYPTAIEPFSVEFNTKRCAQLIGQSIEVPTIKTILEALDIKVVEENGEDWKLEVPPYRVDVQREADVIEEVLRIYGYNQVELPARMTSSLSYSQKPDPTETRHQVAQSVAEMGYNEMMNNSLTSEALYQEGAWATEKLVHIKNPLSSELSVMRQTLLFGALQVVNFNINRKAETISLFEIGNVYSQENGKRKERQNLLLVNAGNTDAERWNVENQATDFFHLKGAVERLFETWGLDQMKIDWKETDHAAYDFALSISINRQEVGVLGKVSAELCKKMEIKQNDVFAAELSWDELFKWMAKVQVKFKPIAKYPSVRRDLALLLDQPVNYQELEALAFKQERKLLKSVNLFDVYEGKNLPEGKKSYALSFTFQDESGTLKDAKVDAVINKVLKAYESQLGAVLR